MKQSLAILALLSLIPVSVAADPSKENRFQPPPAKEGFRYPDCFCTDSKGERVEMGQTSCLRIGSRQVLAKCDMSLNNPTWRTISEGCPSV